MNESPVVLLEEFYRLTVAIRQERIDQSKLAHRIAEMEARLESLHPEIEAAYAGQPSATNPSKE